MGASGSWAHPRSRGVESGRRSVSEMYRIQIVAPGRTGIPEDHFVNTIYASYPAAPSTDAGRDEVAAQMVLALTYAYSTIAPGQTKSMAQLMSNFIDKDNCLVKVYTMEDPPPRTPTTLPWSMIGGLTGTSDLPEEVALCLSIHGLPPITPRRRGRIYMGPLNSTCLGGDTTGPLPSRPTTEAIQIVRSFGELLNQEMENAAINWNIKSERPARNYVPVRGGWCDDAWDTQRRRGVDPTVRYRWPSTV